MPPHTFINLLMPVEFLSEVDLQWAHSQLEDGQNTHNTADVM